MLNNHLDLSGNHSAYLSWLDKAVIKHNTFSRHAYFRTSMRIAGSAGLDYPTNNDSFAMRPLRDIEFAENTIVTNQVNDAPTFYVGNIFSEANRSVDDCTTDAPSAVRNHQNIQINNNTIISNNGAVSVQVMEDSETPAHDYLLSGNIFQ